MRDRTHSHRGGDKKAVLRYVLSLKGTYHQFTEVITDDVDVSCIKLLTRRVKEPELNQSTYVKLIKIQRTRYERHTRVIIVSSYSSQIVHRLEVHDKIAQLVGTGTPAACA